MTASTNNSRRSGGGNSSTPGLEQVAELHAGIYPRDMPIEQLAPTARRMVTSIMSMPSPSVPASEPRASASSEPSPATGRSATSRSRSSRKTSCSPAWRMDSLRLLPSGEISNDSTGDRGVAQWISSLLATRVSRSPSPDDGKEPRTLDISGPMSHACYERPERPSSSARTSPDTCPSASERSEKNWKAWATRLRQDSLRRLKSARLTSGSASSSSPYWGMWPTPTASLTNDGETPESFERRRRLQETGVNGNGAGTPLTIAAKMWQTPRASDGPHGGPNGSKGDLPLPSQSIAETEKLWATPTARDWKDGGAPSMNVPTNSLLGRQAPRSMTSGDASSPSDPTLRPRLRLNPEFVEWLMGLPVGWTVPVRGSVSAFRGSKDSATPSSPRASDTPSGT